MSTVARLDRLELIEILRAKIPEAEKYDRQCLAAHKEAEKKALVTYRTRLRVAATRSYAELKERESNRDKYGYDANRIGFNTPACPVSMADKFRKVIHSLEEWDRRKVIELSDHSSLNGGLFQLYTWEPNPEKYAKDLCG